MSEELSRVKSRQKQYNREGPPAVKSKRTKNTQKLAAMQPAKTKPRAAASTLSRRNSRSTATKNRSADGDSANGKEKESIPSRSDTYSSERVRLSKIFVNSLIFTFVILLAFLLWWGLEGAPPLRTLWW